MRISRTRSIYDNEPRTLDGTWDELQQLLRAPIVTACSADPASPQFCSSLDPSKNDKCAHRGMDGKVGMWGPVIFDGQGKSLKHAVAMDLLTFDVDHVSRTQLEEINQAVTAEGLACVLYSTHSNDPAHNDWCVRLVFPLTEPLVIDRTNQRFDAGLRAFREAIATRLHIPADKATKDESRLYFMPTIPTGGRYLFGVTEGKAIEPVKIETPPIRGGGVSGDTGAGGTRDAPVPVPVFDLDELRAKAVNGANPFTKPAMRRAMKGELITPDDSGTRDVTLNSIASSIAFSCYHAGKDALVELLRPSCNLWSRRTDSDGRSWLGQFENQLERALERARPEKEEEAAKKAMADEAREAMGFTKLTNQPTSQTDQPAKEETDQPKPAKDEEKKYTPEELAGFYKSVGVTDEAGFRTRWIVRYMGANWIWVAGKYERPIKDIDLQYTLMRDLKRSPIQLWEEDEKSGKVFPRKKEDILPFYSSVCRGVQGSLSQRESYYDASEQIFHEAICPPRNIKPAFDKNIDHWLRLFRDISVLDWVAAVSQLQYQCAAIYLKGEKGIGKTLFANGLARIWRTGGPTKFESVMGVSFNSSMADCPLIFADEAIPQTPTIIADLRALIGNDTHDLNRKFMPTVSVRGAIRLIIAGNNEHLLNTPARLEASDVDAMAARILYIDMTGNHDPANFIDALKAEYGKPYVDAWVHGDKLAAHALWLAENRPLNTNERFLVTGQKDFASRLNTQSGNVPAVFEFLARYLSDVSSAKQPTKLLKVGLGRLLVCTELLADKNQFERFVPSRRVLSAISAAQALKQVRENVETVDGKEYHAVKVGLFLDWVRDTQVGDLAVIRGRVEGPVT